VGIVKVFTLLLVSSVLILLTWLYGTEDQKVVDGSLGYSEIKLSSVVNARDGDMLYLFRSDDDRYRLPAKLHLIDRRYQELLLAHEDRRFYKHTGVDLIAMVRAIFRSVISGKVVSGGSTLTMQTVKMLDRQPRNISSKLTEMRRAITLERLLSKDEILQLYLTLIPFGGNVEGVEMGARQWFGKSAESLTPAEAALLVSIPRSPYWFRPDKFPKKSKQDRDRVLKRAFEHTVISESEWMDATLSPVPSKRFAFNKIAPHLALKVKQDEGTVNSTIDYALQNSLHRVAEMLEISSNSNMAIVVADGFSGSVVGYIGSKEYVDKGRAGFVDYAKAIRSPGSTLKPFIYGLAYSRGISSFQTLIKDEPINIGGYRPRNIDHKFRGELSIAEALQLSLNIPAVKVLDRISPSQFYSSLESVGVELKNGDGLPIALGGVGVNLVDLVQLYTVMVNSGKVMPLRFTGDQKVGEAKTLISARAAKELNWILANSYRAEGRVGVQFQKMSIAYKTGTGPGGSDALAVGSNGRYVVGVWIGSIDGGTIAEHKGFEVSAPILQAIFDLLPTATLNQERPSKSSLLLANFDRPQGKREGGVDIIYPVTKSTIVMRNGRSTVPIKIKGDREYPLFLIINGKSVKRVNSQSELLVEAESRGRYDISLLDSGGNIDRVWFNR